MKKLLSFALVSLLTLSASAQITWNAKGGLGVATCIADDDVDLKSKFVGKLGVGIEKPLSANWSLMPSLEIAYKGAKYDFPGGDGDLSLWYAQVPILAAYRININDGWNITLKAGPYFGYAFAGSDSMEGSGYSESVSVFDLGAKHFDAGLDFGIDFEHHRFVFGVEYEFGLTNIFDSSEGEIRNAALYATIGWKF